MEPQPWEGVYDATEHKSICMQNDDLFVANAPVIGSEDCLYINVYTPQVITIN